MNYSISLKKTSIYLVLIALLTVSGTVKAAFLNSVANMAANAEDSVYVVADKMPEFQGGDKALVEFIRKTIVYPAEAEKNNEQGKVIVQFVVSKTGKVEKASILKSISASLDTEALRVINLLPEWIPGEQNGQKVSVSRVLPVAFHKQTEEEMWQVNNKTVIMLDGVKMPENFDIKVLNPSKLTSVKILKPFPKEEKEKLIDKYGKQAADGVVLVVTNKDDMYYAYADSVDESLDCKEEVKLPEFDGGKQNLFRFLNDSIQYPFVAKQLKTEGKVYVRFLVDKIGKIEYTQVMKQLDYYLDKEALRVIKTMPDWTPAKKCGKDIDMFVTMPVSFKLDIPAEKRGWEKNDKTIILLNGKRLPSSFDLGLLNYSNLLSYKILEPGDKVANKKLTSKYGKDAVNGVILIETNKDEEIKN